MDRQADGNRFAEIVAALAETYRRDLTPGLIEGYWLGLHDLALADIERAAQACMKSCKFMPVPAEIRERCEANVVLEAADEWQAVIGKFRGGRAVPGPVAERVVRLMGGYDALGNRSEEQNDTWSRKEFLRLYEEIAANPSALESIAAGAPRLGAGSGSVHPAGWDRMIALACDELGIGIFAKARVRAAKVPTADLWAKLQSLKGRKDAEDSLLAWIGERSPDPDGRIGAGDVAVVR